MFDRDQLSLLIMTGSPKVNPVILKEYGVIVSLPSRSTPS